MKLPWKAELDWRFQLHPYERVRIAFDRCAGCGKRFGLNPGSRIAAGWDSPATFHQTCYAARGEPQP